LRRKRRTPSTLRIAIVGAGNVGAVLGRILREEGHTVTAVVSRTKKSAAAAGRFIGCRRISDALTAIPKATDIIYIAAPHEAIPEVARSLALLEEFDFHRLAVCHASGMLTADALAPRRWPELLFPHLLGEPLGDGASGFWAAASFPWQRYYPVIFAGATLFLTLPFARPRRAGLRPFAWLAGAGLAGAVLLSIPTVAELARRMPGFGSLRFGIKLLVLITVALPPLIATGLVNLRGRWPGTGRRVCLGLLVAVLILTPLAAWPGRLLRPLLTAAYPSARPALAELPDPALRRALALDLAAIAVPPAACLLGGASPPVLAAATLAANSLAARGALPLDEARRWRQPPAAIRRSRRHGRRRARCTGTTIRFGRRPGCAGERSRTGDSPARRKACARTHRAAR